MKRYVFWDLETSTLNASYGSIIQAAAICTDENFNIIDQFDLRGQMKKEFPVPSAKALLVNGASIEQLRSHENTNYGLISKIQSKFLSWGECLFIGYNSISFDDNHLRQSLYQSALPPYITNTNGNKRGDAMKLLHSAAAVYPNAFVRPIDDNTGKITFRLEKFAEANGIAHDNAHDALSDVEATLGVCKLIQERCNDVWESSLKTVSKQDVHSYVDQDKIFCASRFFRGKEYTHGLVYLAKDPSYENHVYFFDLTVDPDLVFNQERSDLKNMFKGKNKCFHMIKANEQPILLNEEYLYRSETFKDITPEIANERLHKIRNNKNFIEKFTNILLDKSEDRELTQDQSEKPLEEQLYYGFPSSKDNYIMSDFHAAEWDKKYELAQKISDERYKEFAKRVIYNERPDCLPKKELEKRDKVIAEKILSTDKCTWNTIPAAYQEIDDIRADEENEDTDLDRVNEIDEYIQELEKDHKKKL